MVLITDVGELVVDVEVGSVDGANDDTKSVWVGDGVFADGWSLGRGVSVVWCSIFHIKNTILTNLTVLTTQTLNPS